MPIRNWIYAVAFGLILLAGSGQAQESTDDSGGQAETSQEPTEDKPFAIPVELIESEAEAQARQSREEEARQREIRDLVAQEGMNASTQAMNRATQDMRDYAFYSTLLVLVGTILLFWNLREIRVANRAAYKAAGAAAQAANSERAWVTFDNFDSGQITNLTIDGVFHDRGFVVVPRWKNTGRSPAVRVDVYVDHRVVAASDPVPHFEPPPASEERRGIFGPGASGTGFWRAVDQQTVERIKAGELKWFVYSKVTYDTTVDQQSEKVSQMCAVVDFNGERIENGEARPNVGLTFIGPQNTAT